MLGKIVRLRCNQQVQSQVSVPFFLFTCTAWGHLPSVLWLSRVSTGLLSRTQTVFQFFLSRKISPCEEENASWIKSFSNWPREICPKWSLFTIVWKRSQLVIGGATGLNAWAVFFFFTSRVGSVTSFIYSALKIRETNAVTRLWPSRFVHLSMFWEIWDVTSVKQQHGRSERKNPGGFSFSESCIRLFDSILIYPLAKHHTAYGINMCAS